jgi:hypothetical protein
MAGAALSQALEPRVAPAARAIESYDAFGPVRVEGGDELGLSSEELERLRALGYL